MLVSISALKYFFFRFYHLEKLVKYFMLLIFVYNERLRFLIIYYFTALHINYSYITEYRENNIQIPPLTFII